ncbi:hypothetical protein AWL63_22620 [Sphingomonas panacis]|uniref:Uncharacterized protein n=2 Tax=Sphingomonas panacis TaxID=1560345 RepID=A0A1B3ZHX9_9SPHN|nr:hypothetical protein AWL63_22620 [Sphingomonas panacis]
MLTLTGAADAPDWASALRQDAQAFHDDIATNHPGMVDTANPRFASKNDRQLALAVQRARRTREYAGYWFALRAYAAAFDDGHLEFGAGRDQVQPQLPTRWPGFLTAIDDDGRQRVATHVDWSRLPIGAELIECDGRSADALAKTNVGAFSGRWFLRAVRMEEGGRLFLDQGNPWVTRPSICTFLVETRRRSVKLDWRIIDPAERDRHLARTFSRAAEPIGMRTLPDNSLWITLSDFKGDPEGPAAKALVPLIARLTASPESLRNARAIVLDLRGNHGGSSDWSRQIARLIWGKPAVDAVNLGSDAVEWRASSSNIATLKQFAASLDASSNSSPEVRGWLGETIAGMELARMSGKPVWANVSAAKRNSVSDRSIPTLGRPVLMITDPGCGSACLDAADLWLALGAIHVGQQTSADTVYMDARKDTLPSGFGRVVLPMKVYRGRKRGSNVPLTPSYVFRGSLADTQSLERWVSEIINRLSSTRSANMLSR